MNSDKIATLIGFAIAALVGGQQALAAYDGGQVNWGNVAAAALFAALGYWTNKQKKPPVDPSNQ